MEGEQERLYKVLNHLADKVKDGAYGEGSDLDTQALEEDIEEQVWEN